MTGLLALGAIGIALFALFGGRKRAALPELPPAPPGPAPGPAPEPPPGDVVTPDVSEEVIIREVQEDINRVLAGLDPPRRAIDVDGDLGPETCGAHEWLARQNLIPRMLDCTGISSVAVPPILSQRPGLPPGTTLASDAAFWRGLLQADVARFGVECARLLGMSQASANAMASVALPTYDQKVNQGTTPEVAYNEVMAFLSGICPGWR